MTHKEYPSNVNELWKRSIERVKRLARVALGYETGHEVENKIALLAQESDHLLRANGFESVGLYESDEAPKGNLSIVEWRSDVAPYDDEAYIPRDSQGGDASAAWAEQYPVAQFAMIHGVHVRDGEISQIGPCLVTLYSKPQNDSPLPPLPDEWQ